MPDRPTGCIDRKWPGSPGYPAPAAARGERPSPARHRGPAARSHRIARFRAPRRPAGAALLHGATEWHGSVHERGQVSGWFPTHASVAELADALGSGPLDGGIGSSRQIPCNPVW